MGMSISNDTLKGLVLAMVILVTIFTIMFGPPLDHIYYLMGIMGLNPDAINHCRTEAQQDVGTVCAGEFNTCNVIESEAICEEAGCTWKTRQSRCIEESGDTPACENLSPLHCTEVNR